MVKLCTELFYAILPTCFLLICYPYILLCFLILFMSLSFSSKCMLELKFAIYHRAAVYPHRLPQRCMQYWLKNRRQSLFKHWVNNGCPRLSLSLSTQPIFLIQQSWITHMCFVA